MGREADDEISVWLQSISKVKCKEVWMEKACHCTQAHLMQFYNFQPRSYPKGKIGLFKDLEVMGK